MSQQSVLKESTSPPIPALERGIFWSASLGLYQAGLLLFGAVYLALRLLSGRSLTGIRERLACYPADASFGKNPLWIHVCSVGEAMTAQPLIEELRVRYPQKDWVISTVTSSGRSVAQRLIRPGRDRLIYLPWDLTPVAGRAVKAIAPSLFLAFETELWPVLFLELGKSGVPIAVVNGRISPRAYRRYLWAHPWMERALKPVSLFLTQSPQDAKRFAGIGAAKDRLAVAGNLKWEQKVSTAQGEQVRQLRESLPLVGKGTLWTAGSTHPGEEEQLIRVFTRLKKDFPNLQWVLAPRHPERSEQIMKLLRQTGLSAVLRSRMKFCNGSVDVIVLDSLGELSLFYGASDLVFVGGSLVEHGGHNLVEPAALGKPTLTGPHLQNFAAVAEALRACGGVAVVANEDELERSLRKLLTEPALAKQLGDRAHAAFRENQGTALKLTQALSLRWAKELS